MTERGIDRIHHRRPLPPRRQGRRLLLPLGRGAATLAVLSKIVLATLLLPFSVPQSGSGVPPLFLSLCTVFAQSNVDPSSGVPDGGKSPSGLCPVCLLVHNAGFFPSPAAVTPAAPGDAAPVEIVVAPPAIAAGTFWPRPFARAPPA